MKFSIVNAPPKTTFALFLQNNPRRYCQDTIVGGSYNVDVPDDMAGLAQLTVSVPRTDRLTFVKNYKVDIDLQGDYTMDLADIDKPDHVLAPPHNQESTQELQPTTSNQQPTANKSPKAKKLITNKLQEQVRENTQVKKLADLELTDQSDTKKNFWDRFK